MFLSPSLDLANILVLHQSQLQSGAHKVTRNMQILSGYVDYTAVHDRKRTEAAIMCNSNGLVNEGTCAVDAIIKKIF